jgi:hypothetical protein
MGDMAAAAFTVYLQGNLLPRHSLPQQQRAAQWAARELFVKQGEQQGIYSHPPVPRPLLYNQTLPLSPLT